MKTTRLELSFDELSIILKARLATIAEIFNVNGRLLSLEECATIRKKLLAYENTLRSAAAKLSDPPRREPTMEFPVVDPSRSTTGMKPIRRKPMKELPVVDGPPECVERDEDEPKAYPVLSGRSNWESHSR